MVNDKKNDNTQAYRQRPQVQTEVAKNPQVNRSRAGERYRQAVIQIQVEEFVSWSTEGS